jgi:FkbM family methyltransferase
MTPGREFLLRGSEQVVRLLSEVGAGFSALPDGVLLEVNGVKLKLVTWEELFIAAEVFCDGIYNLNINEPFVFIDVGMNVGTTSLFFARQTACRVVHAFELFPKTAARARTNLELNPEITAKIEITTKGLAAKPSSAELDYNEEYKGSIGRDGLPEYARPQSESIRYEKARVEFVSCAEAFANIATRHSDLPLVCKLDCEGAEYEILDALDASGQLRQIECFMIEWHRKGSASIEALLQKNGFAHLSFNPKAPNHGMIYAWKRGTQR